jgi:hypothetical protein
VGEQFVLGLDGGEPRLGSNSLNIALSGEVLQAFCFPAITMFFSARAHAPPTLSSDNGSRGAGDGGGGGGSQ